MFGREGTRWMLGALVALALGAWAGATRAALDLGGRWEFALDPRGTGEAEGLFSDALPDWVTLPGTTDTNRKGTPAPKPATSHPSTTSPTIDPSPPKTPTAKRMSAWHAHTSHRWSDRNVAPPCFPHKNNIGAQWCARVFVTYCG